MLRVATILDVLESDNFIGLLLVEDRMEFRLREENEKKENSKLLFS